jgi:hypothetical protein
VLHHIGQEAIQLVTIIMRCFDLRFKGRGF